MCIRNNSEQQQQSLTSVATNEEDDASGISEPVNGIPESHPRGGGRRNSCFTEEGFEIALPNASGAAAHSKSERRRSVFDEDGHEIVLCSQDASAVGGGGGEDGQAKISPPPKTAGAQARKQTPQTHSSGNKAEAFISRGGSCIVSPFGDVIAGPQWEDEEGIIYADVDFEDCVRGRLDLDVGGSYSRNDSFRFEVQGLDMDPLPYY